MMYTILCAHLPYTLHYYLMSRTRSLFVYTMYNVHHVIYTARSLLVYHTYISPIMFFHTYKIIDLIIHWHTFAFYHYVKY